MSMQTTITLPALNSIPTVRYVYLVQDTADVDKMGGSSKNVYSTFQAAYDAANALQVSLAGSNIVCIKVGNISSAAAGDLTLTADFNRFVQIEGLSPVSSILGNIIATNASGNGYHIGGAAASQSVKFTSCSIGNINTKLS